MTGPLRFKADFLCSDCGTELHVETYVAVVRSQTGYLYACPHCKQVFKVTDQGAFPVSNERPQVYIDAGANAFYEIPPFNPDWK